MHDRSPFILKDLPNFRPNSRAAMAALLCSLAAVSSSALAQTSAPAAPPATTPVTTQATSGEPGRLADVIVTAQKVAQPAGKAAISITAIGGEELRTLGVANATALTTLMPNVQISSGSAGSTDISIRGIVSTNTTEVGDPAAAFHVDGVYLGRPQSAGANFYDLERVEVLRGPQGTLYGRNATAGAVNLITNKPGKKFAGEANVLLGTQNLKAFEGMVNVPVNSTLALRAVVSSTNRDGFLITADGSGVANTFSKNRDDVANLSARVHGLLTFSANTKLLLTADMSNNKGAGPGSVPLATYQTKTGSEQRTVLTNKNEGARDDKSTGLAAEFTANVGVGELTYLGARRTFDRNNLSSTGAVSSLTVSGFTQTSHELRLASNPASNPGSSPLTWVGGLYAFDEQGNIDATFGINPFGAANPGYRFIQTPVTSKSTAAFGQVTYSLTPTFRLTAGLRHTKDDKVRDGRITNAAGSFNFPPGDNKAAVSYSQSTWKLGADADLAPGVLGYVSAATGYKAGGYFDGSNAKGDNTYRPELLTSVEAGLKGRFLNNRLRLSASVFSYDYKDLQISYVALNPLTNAAGTITTNAARARNNGIELEAKLALGDNGTLNVGAGLLDATYDSFTFPVTLPARPVAIDYAGKMLDRAPSATLNLGYTHDWALGNGAAVTAYIGTRYSSAYVLSNFAVATPVQYTQASHTRTDVNATYNAAGDKWYLQAYGRNLENRTVMTGFTFSSFTGSQVFLNEARSFGLRGGVRF